MMDIRKKKYKVEITETLQRIVEIEANSEEEACKQVKQMYEDEKIVLDSNDHIETMIEKYENK